MFAYGAVNLQEVFRHPVAGWQTSEIPFYGRRLNIIISVASPTSPWRSRVLVPVRDKVGIAGQSRVRNCNGIFFHYVHHTSMPVLCAPCRRGLYSCVCGVPGNMVVNGVVSRGKLSGNKREN